MAEPAGGDAGDPTGSEVIGATDPAGDGAAGSDGIAAADPAGDGAGDPTGSEVSGAAEPADGDPAGCGAAGGGAADPVGGGPGDPLGGGAGDPVGGGAGGDSAGCGEAGGSGAAGDDGSGGDGGGGGGGGGTDGCGTDGCDASGCGDEGCGTEGCDASGRGTGGRGTGGRGAGGGATRWGDRGVSRAAAGCPSGWPLRGGAGGVVGRGAAPQRGWIAKSSKSRGSSGVWGGGGGESKSSQDSVVGGVGWVGSIDVRWVATWFASGGRFSGVVASSLATSVARPTGTSARFRAGIGSPRMRSTRSPGCSPRRPGWGERPVRAKCRTAPKPYKSVSSFRVPLRRVSGGRYSMACSGSLVKA